LRVTVGVGVRVRVMVGVRVRVRVKSYVRVNNKRQFVTRIHSISDQISVEEFKTRRS
jgi:hypothetical protein